MGGTMDHDAVRSQRGALLWVVASAYLLISSFVLQMLLASFRGEDFGRGPFGSVILLGFLGLLLCFSAYLISSSITITPEALTVRSIFGSRTIALRDVLEIKIVPIYGDTIFWGYNVIVRTTLSQGIAVYASLYANRHQLLAALIYHARRASGGIDIDRSLLNRYSRRK